MPDVIKTRAELVVMAADELGITSPGQSLAVEDSGKIDSRLDGLIGELAAREVVYVPNLDEIPIEISGPLALLLANESAGAFGQPRLADPAREAIEERIRVAVQRQPPAEPELRVDTMWQGGASHLTGARWSRGF